jgi:uncharacterized protein
MAEEKYQDGLIRELPLIKKHAENNANSDENFRQYLKTRLPLSNDELDGVVQGITNEVWEKLDCTTCGNCCRTLQIVVDQKDAARLARRFGITTKAFTERYLAVDQDGMGYFRASPPCPFLGDDNLCAVYEDRPRACRDFPYLHERNVRSRSYTMVDNCATCPIVFNVWERLKERFRPPPRSIGKKRR